MGEARFNMKLINVLKDLLLRLHRGELLDNVQKEFHQYFHDIDAVEILLIVHELKSNDLGITSEDINKIFSVYPELYGRSIEETYGPESFDEGHPVEIFTQENRAIESALDNIRLLMEEFAGNEELFKDESAVENLQDQVMELGQFINHYHRKEKLFFPILERYGYFSLNRIMWADDDRIRNLYKGTKSMLERMTNLDFTHIQKTYDLFEQKCKDMIFQEETFLLPVLLAYFAEDDWVAVAEESDAFGYAMIEPGEEWSVERNNLLQEANMDIDDEDIATQQLPFGVGFLTIKEADHILNNLPLEITFVNKYGLFKYFNEKVQSSEMMFVRTSSSIGRNIMHCHPPKSMKKVMRLVRDLQMKRRTSETMWFKKDGKYVHITYKGLFDEGGEYLGVLEYVQDIQPFLDLPREVKKELEELK